MNVFPKFSYRNGNTNFVSTEQLDLKSDEIVFCTEDNIKESLHELSEVMTENSTEVLININHKLICRNFRHSASHR